MDRPFLFRTYENLHRGKTQQTRKLDRNPGQGHDVPIWQVARATSAAPTYFKPMTIDGRQYLDGGFGSNNPVVEIYDEIRRMNNHAKKCVRILISIGTGKTSHKRFTDKQWTRYWNYANFAAAMASKAEGPHFEMEKRMTDLEHADTYRPKYYRLNVETGLDKMKLDQWRVRGRWRTELGGVIGWLTKILDGNDSRVSPAGTQEAEVPNGDFVEGGRQTSDEAIPLDSVLSVQEQLRQRDLITRNDESSATEANDPSRPQISVAQQHGNDVQSRESEMAQTQAQSAPSSKDQRIPTWFQPRNKTLDTIRECTRAYINSSTQRTEDGQIERPVKKAIEECAEILVQGRRNRASHKDRWEKSCFNTWYQCLQRGCPRGEKKYPHRVDLERHITHKHRKLLEMEWEKEDRDDLQHEDWIQRLVKKKLDECKFKIY